MSGNNKCQVSMHNGKVCERLVCGREWDGERDRLCILPSGSPIKNKGQFQAGLESVFADENAEFYDLTVAVFPPGVWEAISPIMDHVIYLHSTTFLGDVLIGQVFEHSAHFHETRYRGNVIIRFGRGAMSPQQFRLAFRHGDCSCCRPDDESDNLIGIEAHRQYRS
jgi:hypothetical protein